MNASTILPYLVADYDSPPPFVNRSYGEPLFFTDSDVAALQYSGEDTLWSIEESGVLRQWSPEGRLITRHFLSDLETQWAFNFNATYLASGSDELSIWETNHGKVERRIPVKAWVTALAFSSDDSILASGHDDGKVRLWKAPTLELISEIVAHQLPISALSFRMDQPQLASAGEDRVIRIWDVQTRACLSAHSGHPDRIPALAWHPRGEYLISAGWDTTARVWQPPLPEPTMLLNSHSEQVNSVSFSPDGNYLACADSDFAIHIWNDPKSGRTQYVLHGHSDEIRCLTFSQNCKRLASAGSDRVVHIWDMQTGQLVAGPNPQLRHSIALSERKEQTELFSTAGASLHAWETTTGANSWNAISGDSILCVSTSPDGKWCVASNQSPEVRLFDVVNRKLVRTLNHTRGPIRALTFSPDSSLIATASVTDGLVWVWKIGEEEAILVIPEAAESCGPESIAFHPNNKILAVGGLDWLSTSGADGDICLWDLDSRDKWMTLETGVTSLAFDPAGKFLAAGSLRQSVMMWDINQQSVVFDLPGHQDRIGAIAFSPDGSWLISGSDDSTIRVWDVLSGRLVIARQFDAAIQSMHFSADGKYLYTGNGNSTCYQLEMKRLLED